MTLVATRPRASARAGRRPAIVGQAVLFLVIVAGCWVAVLGVAAPTSTDPVLRSTSPGNGQTARPERLLLTFDRPVPAGFVTVRLTDPYNRPVALERPRRVDGRADTISVPMPRIQFAGTYAVAWRMPSSLLEPIGGTFTFDFVSRSPPQPAPRIDTGRSTVIVVVATVARFVAFAALVVLVGAAFFVAVIGPPDGARRVRRLMAYAWVGLLAATLAVLVSFGPYAAWAPLADAVDPDLLRATFQSETGHTLLARLLVLALAGFGLAELVHAQPLGTTRERLVRGGGVLAGSAALAATWSFSGHSAVGSLVPLALSIDIVHLTAAGVWAGGLVAMATVQVRNRDVSAFGSVVRRFCRVMWVCLGVLVLTGAYQGWREVGGLRAVTSYGWLLGAKIGLVGAVALLGGFAGRWWLRRHEQAADQEPDGRTAQRKAAREWSPVERTRLRRQVLLQAAVASTILAVTALLVTREPAHAGERQSVRRLPAPARLAFDTGGPGGRGSLDLVVVPATVGRNTVHVSVLDARGAPTDGIAVDAVLRRSGQRSASVRIAGRELAPGHLVDEVTIPARGPWELALTVRSAGGHRQTLSGVVDVG